MSGRGDNYDKRARPGDTDNTFKGGVGIDGNKDNDFVKKNQDWDAVTSQFGRSWFKSPSFGLELFDCDYTDEGWSNSKVLENSREGYRNEKSPEQTGVRTDKPKRRLSGAW